MVLSCRSCSYKMHLKSQYTLSTRLPSIVQWFHFSFPGMTIIPYISRGILIIGIAKFGQPPTNFFYPYDSMTDISIKQFIANTVASVIGVAAHETYFWDEVFNGGAKI